MTPDDPIGYTNLVNYYLALGRWDEAKSAYDQAMAEKLDSDSLGVIRYYLAFASGDTTTMQAQAAWSAGKPGVEDWVLSIEADTAAYDGQLAKARELSRQAVESAERAGAKDVAALWEANVALSDAEFGESVEAQRAVGKALGGGVCQFMEVVWPPRGGPLRREGHREAQPGPPRHFLQIGQPRGRRTLPAKTRGGWC